MLIVLCNTGGLQTARVPGGQTILHSRKGNRTYLVGRLEVQRNGVEFIGMWTSWNWTSQLP